MSAPYPIFLPAPPESSRMLVKTVTSIPARHLVEPGIGTVMECCIASNDAGDPLINEDGAVFVAYNVAGVDIPAGVYAFVSEEGNPGYPVIIMVDPMPAINSATSSTTTRR